MGRCEGAVSAEGLKRETDIFWQGLALCARDLNQETTSTRRAEVRREAMKKLQSVVLQLQRAVVPDDSSGCDACVSPKDSVSLAARLRLLQSGINEFDRHAEALEREGSSPATVRAD